MKVCARFLILVYCCLALRIAESAKRRSRQFHEDFTGCSFDVTKVNSAKTSSIVSSCNFTVGFGVPGIKPWNLVTSSQVAWTGGPKSDASNSTTSGFAYVDTSSLASDATVGGLHPKAWIQSPVYPPTDPQGQCFKFKFNMDGLSASKLRLLRVQFLPAAEPGPTSILLPTLWWLGPSELQPPDALPKSFNPWGRSAWPLNITESPGAVSKSSGSGSPEATDELWSSSDSTGGSWVEGHVTYSTPYPHVLIFEAVPELTRSQFRGYVAIDELSFQEKSCQYECEFNVGFCDWSNSKEDDFDWSVGHGTLRTHTGPLRDQLSSTTHTDFGGYAYIDSRYPHYAGRKASLISDTLPATTEDSALCFIFWVHMHGEGIGQLRVLKKTDEEEIEVWKLRQRPGTREVWWRAQVTLASQVAFKIKVEATIGESGNGDIAIDSFRFHKGTCPGLPQGSVNNGATDCTFQDGPCGWVATNSYPAVAALWTRASLNYFSGLPDGHNRENAVAESSANAYMSFDTHVSIQGSGSRGFLTSPVFKGSNGIYCLSFWFYQATLVANLPRIGSLEVILFQPNYINNTTTSKQTPLIQQRLWRLNNHQQERWTYAQVSFEVPNGGYVSFVGMRGNGIRGIIAVDDITVHSGQCSTLPKQAAVGKVDCYFDFNLCNWRVDPPATTISSTTTASTTAATTTASATVATTTTPVASSTLATGTTTAAATTTESASVTTTTTPAATTIQTAGTTESATESTTTTTTTATTVATTATTTPEARNAANEAATQTTVPSAATSGTTEATTTGSSQASATSVSSSATSSTSLGAETTTSATPSATSSIISNTTEASQGSASSTSSSATSNPSLLAETSTAAANSAFQKPASTRATDRVALSGSSSGETDQITPLGVANLIEVVSVTKNGASKSIIISQPRRLSRSVKPSQSGWIGYNEDPSRIPRIVTYPNSQGLKSQAPASPHSRFQARNPAPDNSRIYFPREEAAAGYINAYSAGSAVYNPSQYVSGARLRPQVNPESSTASQIPFTQGKWTLAAKSNSLAFLRDHTFQFPEGGYVYFETVGKLVTTTLHSPGILVQNSSYCLTFFFALASNDPNSTLSVKRQTEENRVGQQLWSITSANLKHKSNPRYTSTSWIPAQLPIEPSDQAQVLYFEGSATNGGFALDDIYLSQEEASCQVLPEIAAVSR